MRVSMLEQTHSEVDAHPPLCTWLDVISRIHGGVETLPCDCCSPVAFSGVRMTLVVPACPTLLLALHLSGLFGPLSGFSIAPLHGSLFSFALVRAVTVIALFSSRCASSIFCITFLITLLSCFRAALIFPSVVAGFIGNALSVMMLHPKIRR